ncbi:peptide chain release factor N(5)-glutamine methyltransferase [Chlamydia sp. 17-3921]|uniref:peptide chain release factor N(5)-glutamine methyltransferase n=1 Tax=Chlamydia sp. 17-3921 TaxID=2675798 RepID=UPI0019188C65|nr:peptide chain release factor N(5)-glutamine methyltransferase [Chlamydia sp. 17-3921]
MELKTILKEAAEYLKYYGVAFEDREAAYILMDLLGITSLAQLREHSFISDDVLLAYYQKLKFRGERCPTAYIHGSVSFLGLSLIVDSRVLIPRMETEILAEQVIKYILAHSEIQTVYDVCCGSGCLGLAIKKFCPHIKVFLSDICPKAVSVAKQNAVNNGLNVEVFLGDLFDPYSSPGDVLVCNPPYLSFKEVMRVDPEVRCYEPWKALVGGATGLEFYIRIAENLSKILHPHGVGWLEIGYNQGIQVQTIFSKYGISGRLQKDLSGWDRFFFLEMDASDPVSSAVYS